MTVKNPKTPASKAEPAPAAPAPKVAAPAVAAGAAKNQKSAPKTEVEDTENTQVKSFGALNAHLGWVNAGVKVHAANDLNNLDKCPTNQPEFEKGVYPKMVYETHPVVSHDVYRNIKRHIKRFEKTNYDSIVVFPSTGSGNWCKVGELSALKLRYFIEPKLKHRREFKIQRDTDFFHRLTTGVITFQSGPVGIYDKLVEAGELVGITYYSGGIVRFYLKTTLNAESEAQLREKEEQRRLRQHEIITPKMLDPGLYAVAVRTMADTARYLRKIPKDEVIFRNDLLLRTAKFMDRYVYACNHLDEKEAPQEVLRLWQDLIRMTEEIMTRLYFLAEIGSLQAERSDLCCRNLAELRDLLARRAELLERKIKNG